eukprot:scaffold1431_cov346-Pavlova_lutheri.AAC.36
MLVVDRHTNLYPLPIYSTTRSFPSICNVADGKPLVDLGGNQRYHFKLFCSYHLHFKALQWRKKR